MSTIRVVNSGPDTIKVTVNETPKVNVSVTSSSAINIEPGITSAERSKLASIDAGATADQTDAEIKTAYENNANTNAFTDAEQTKLAGIESGAKPDQVLTGGTNISLSESSGDYTINLDNSIGLSGTLDVSGDATLDSNLTVDGDITVSDSISAIFQTESASDNINVGAQTVKFNRSTGGSIQATSSNADISLKSLSGDASIKGRNVTIQIGENTSTRAFEVFDENASFNQNRFVVDGRGTTTFYQADESDSGAKLFEIKAAGTSPFALEHVQIGPDSGGYKLPAADGSANTFLQTNGSGTVTFVAPTISDLSDSSNVTTLDGTQTITGNKTFSGVTVLNLLSSNGAVINGSASATSLSVSGTTSVNSLEVTTSIQAQSLTLISQSNSASEIVTVESGLTPSDLHLKSNGNVKLFLDQDDNESGQKFIVANNAGTEKFSAQEDGTVTVYGKIVSASNGDIDIEPNGTGDVLLGNFKFDADQSVGSGQDNFVLTYDNSTGKISLEAATGGGGGGGGASALNDLSDVSTSGVSNGDVLVANVSGNFSPSSNLQDLVTMLKGGSSTTLTSVGDGTSTDKGVLNLGASSASLKYNTTGITIDEASPGDIEFIVATDSSGSTPFTALHIDGSATASVAETIIKTGNTLKLEDSSGDKVWLRVPNVSSDTTVLLPATDGTIALTSQVPSNVTDLSDVSSAGSGSIITSSERTKLTNIETAADVTDATNVAAAGALMASSAQLTGNLDVQANEINTTTSNGNVKVAANGTGVLELRGNNGSGSDDNPGAIKLNCAENSHGITLKAPAHSAFSGSYTLTLPPGVESSDANKVLQTDASGNLDWVALPSDTNTQNTTTLSFEDSTDDIILRNTTGGAGSGTQDIKFVAGSNITLTHTDANNITIASSGGDGSGGIASVSEDSTPTLGGDLIVGSNDIKSVGDVEVVVDSDNNTADSSFTVKNGAGTILFSVNESGITSGLLTTATPTATLASSFLQGASVTGTVDNFDSDATYVAKIFNSGGTEQTSNPVTISNSGGISFTAPSTAASGYELRISAAGTGKLISDEVVKTFEVTQALSFTHWRLQIVDSSGNADANRIALVELEYYPNSNQGGTHEPDGDATNNTSISGVTISAGHTYSTYYPWRAFDGTLTGMGSAWWNLGTSAANNWIQLEFSSAETFQSLRLIVSDTFNNATHFQVLGSNTGSFSGEELTVLDTTAINEGSTNTSTTVNF